MRIGGPHLGTPVLEDLDPPVGRAELRRLLRPDVDHIPYRFSADVRERQVMAPAEADHPARAGFALGDEEAVLDALRAAIGSERGEVVREDEGRVVLRVPGAARALVAGAQVALGVVRRPGIARRRLDLALPRTLGALRGDEDPLIGERVVASMRRGQRSRWSERQGRHGGGGAGPLPRQWWIRLTWT